MSEFSIFKKKYSSLFTEYGYGITTIQHILHSIGYDLTNLHTEEARKEAIYVIYELLRYDIIKVIFLNGEYMRNKKINIKEIISILEKIWTKGETDFETIINFEYQDWYYQKLSELNIDENTDWKWFKNDFVPNMKHWIKENRPK